MRPRYGLAAALTVLALLVTASFVQSQTSAEQPAVPPSIQYPSHISAAHAAPPAGTLTNPNKGSKEIATAGASLFATMNCDGCHGGGATGFAALSLADGRWRYGGSDQEIFQSIYFGRPKGMPAFGGVLGLDGVWILVTYLQSIPVPANIATQSWEKP